jgi:hypothetical protein
MFTLCQARPSPVVDSSNGFERNNLQKSSLSFQEFFPDSGNKESENPLVIISLVNQLPDSREKQLEEQGETDEETFDSRLGSGPNEELDAVEEEKPQSVIDKSVAAGSNTNHKNENKPQESSDVALIVTERSPEPDTGLNDGVTISPGVGPTSADVPFDIKASPFLIAPPVAPELFKTHYRPLSLLEELGPLF